MISKIKQFVGYEENLDPLIINTYMISTLFICVSSLWLFIDIFIGIDIGIILQNLLLVSLFLLVYWPLKHRKYLMAKTLLIILSVFHFYLAVFVYFGPETGIYQVLYLLIPQATMTFDMKSSKERRLMFISILVIMFVLLYSQTVVVSPLIPLTQTQKTLVKQMTIITIISTFAFVYYKYAQKLSQVMMALEASSERDWLTGLYNRRAFTKFGTACFENGESAPFALVILDIDYFKKVNDTWGHLAGDQVLKELAICLQRAIKTREYVARLGGEEFALILETEDGSETLSRLDEVMEKVRQMRVSIGDDVTISLTVSMGLACYSSRMECFDTMFRKADIALYRAKHMGRNRIEIFNPHEADEKKN
jgi:diguanylate cyclase (GGDEF)-like protein